MLTLDQLTVSELLWMGGGTLLTGLAVFLFSLHIIGVVFRPLPAPSHSWQFNQSRLWKLRNGSPMFLYFEPMIQELQLALSNPSIEKSRLLKRIKLNLGRGGCNLPFTSMEFLAHTVFQAVFITIAAFAAGFLYMSALHSALFAILMALFVSFTSIRKLEQVATTRMNAIKRRLPFCIDLLALTMQAGATFRDSLNTVVRETGQTPAGAEMERLQNHISAGQTLARSLEGMQTRLQDPEIDELVITVTNSDTLGTSLADIFLRLADQVRMKRSQALERKAGQAQTMMVFPGFIIMIACLMIVVAPFALAAYMNPTF